MPTSRTVTQYAIRTKNHDGSFTYRLKTNPRGGRDLVSEPRMLTREEAIRGVRMFTKDCEPTAVVRTVVLIEDEWEEVQP